MKFISPLVLSATLALSIPPVLQAESLPSQAEMWRIIQQQQQQLEALQKQLRMTTAKVQATDEKIEVTAAKVQASDEKAEVTAAKVDATEEKAEAAVTAVEESKTAAASWAERTQIGGYGELHYNNLAGEGAAVDKDEVDLHRFVLFFGHQFNDRIRLFSELEIEHAISGDGENGEVELEQAYLEMDLTAHHRLAAGVQLIPVGFLNQTHEPPTFYGVERNPVETFIIPTTWWEAGLGVQGEVAPAAIPGLSYHVLLHSGLETPVAGGNAFKIRNGRQKVSEAPADAGAITAQLKWTGYPGVEIGTTLQYQQDVTQDALAEAIDAFLFEAHAELRRGPFGLRALYARWNLDDGGLGIGPASGASVGRELQYGWYIEPSYRIPINWVPGEIGVFGRYNEWDNNAGANGDSGERQYNVGLNYWPHPLVVFKVDAQFQNNEDGDDQDGFNLGVGYQF